MRELQLLLIGCLIGYSIVITLAYQHRGRALARKIDSQRVAYDHFVEQVAEKNRCKAKLNLCILGR